MRKKTNQIISLCLIAALALGMTACGKEAKIEKKLTLGQVSMDAGDYLAAITAYEEVISLDKYEIAGYEGLVNAMVKDNRDSEEIKAIIKEVTVVLEELKKTETGIPEEKKAEAENFYVQASTVFSENADEELEILKSGVDVLGEDSQLADTYETKAEELIDHYLEGNNLEEAKQQAEQLAQTIPSNSENETLVEEVTEKAEAEQALVDILLTAHGYIEKKSWRSLAYFSESEELAIIKEKIGDVGNYTYIFGGGTTGLGIGYYSMEGCSCDQWYVGNYVDGIRSGNGGWYWAKKDGSDLIVEIYEGNWENDIPNGNGHLYIKDGNGVYQDDDVIVKNGLLHGTFTRVSGQYSDSYEAIDGIYVEKTVPDWIKAYVEEGRYVYWAGSDATGEIGRIATVPYGSKHGVAHFRN